MSQERYDRRGKRRGRLTACPRRRARRVKTFATLGDDARSAKLAPTWSWPSSRLTVEPRPRDGGTEVHLVHRGLTESMADAHAGGWSNYVARLAAVAEGRDPGPDLLADERVPSATEVRRS